MNLKDLKGEFRIFIDFFFKGQTITAPQEKIVAPLKRVYLDAFQVMRLAITLQFSKMTKNGAKCHNLMKKNHKSY